MTAIRIVALCLAAAMICSALRSQRPEMATALSLAVGIGALLMTGDAFGELSASIQRFSALAELDGGSAAVLLKAAGITVISELGVQICSDAGESALAGRIRLATRVVMLGMAMPLVLDIVDSVGAVLG